MRICIPTETKEGLKAKVFEHFGSAPYFTVYDTEKEQTQVIDNVNAEHEHGMCQPADIIGSAKINVVICLGMGRRALEKLNESGIKAFRQNGETVAEIVRKYKADELEELTVENACGHHHGGGCH